MKYFSLNNKAPVATFQEAVINGLAPDKGLYFPEEIKPLDKNFIDKLENYSNTEIAYEVIKQFIGNEIPENELKKIISETLSFDFPLVKIKENIYSLELFHGPTMAFKDVGARFMARCLGYFKTKNKTKDVTVLVATSGDTGGAVASGFLGVKGVNVVILYPSGKVSDVQEKQLTTLGENITALEVNGTFDDCQDMVKTAFLDDELNATMNLTSANSINVARWLPQMFYFFYSFKKLKQYHNNIYYSVPSGNFGNICAGMMAQKLGLPITGFITATNVNNIVPIYLKTGIYKSKPSIQTISNAMDVGNPSNFVRILKLHNDDIDLLRSNLKGLSYTDKETEETMLEVFKKSNYILDPHGAIGYKALNEFYLKIKVLELF